MKRTVHLRPATVLAATICALAGSSLKAQTYFWEPTGGGTFDWNVPVNWDPDGIPSLAGDVANVNSDLLGGQTIRLQQPITIGTLNLGESAASAGSFAFTIGNDGAETFALTFDSGTVGTPAQVNLNATGTPANTLAVPILLNSNLTVNLGSGSQTLTVSTAGSLATGSGANAKNIVMTGGTTGQNQFTILGDLSGEGTITNNSNTSLAANNSIKTFTGTFVLNKGLGGSNTGSLTVTTGSIANAAEVIINGYLSAGIVQNGGSLHSGNNSPAGANPGQRLTQNRITLNGGSLTPGGQSLMGAALNTEVSDTVGVLDFNSNYSLLTLGWSSTSSGTRFNITTMERTPGATAFVRSGTLGGTARMIVDNAPNFLVGAFGTEGTTTMSIIPWMVAANTNGFAGSAATFATHTATGIRGLLDTEYANSLTAGVDHNVSVGGVALVGVDPSVTVNTLRYTSGGTTNIGSGKTIIVANGGLIFQNGGGTIGASGNATAGTLQFGIDGDPTEGVIWANSTNTNTIGASLSGSLGLTKTGTGTLVLTGTNTYTGTTYVGAGTLQVGNGTNPSNLGLFGDVTIASGATLSLFNGLAIADTATLRLEQFIFGNGKVSLGAGVDETIGGLFFNDSFAIAGTYGSTTSSAMFQNDTYFSGPGLLTVVPEPGSITSLLGGFGLLLGLQRRRR